MITHKFERLELNENDKLPIVAQEQQTWSQDDNER